MKERTTIVGVMSGTSLDGLDLVAVEFNSSKLEKFTILASRALDYNESQKTWLEKCSRLGGEELIYADREFGRFIGSQVAKFISEHNLSIDAVASHGHTIFHNPDMHLTYQLGHGASIAASCEKTTISDFRSLDVALGGQGAPLVPIGDEILFGQYGACLNLGGFSNVSYRDENKRIAFDICPANMPLNQLAEQMELRYDLDGEIAKSGTLRSDLLSKLNNLPYYQLIPPKSLGREWYEQHFKPLLANSGYSITDQMRTAVEHIALQVSHSLNGKSDVLVTGGGARNKFLIDRIDDLSSTKIIVPNPELIDFKEAIIFALLGYLRLNHQTNNISSVTGAKHDSVGGAIHLF